MASGNHLVREFFSVFLRVLWRTKGIYVVLFLLICLGGFFVGRVENMAWGDGFYFAMVTGLTIGYGDITPVTFIGRLIALCLGFVGIVLTGMIVAAAVFSLQKAWHATEQDSKY